MGGWLRSSRLVFHSMNPPPAGVPWRLTLRLPFSPRAPAAMAGPRGRIDLSTLPCQQPLGHNLTWKRVEPHPHGSPGWQMRWRVHVYAVKTLRGEGDMLHEKWIRQAQKKTEETGLPQLSICGQKICSYPMEMRSKVSSSILCTNKFKFVQEW